MSACPQAVLDYLANWEDVEPFQEPSQVSGAGISLRNVWAIWRDEVGNLHALDYTNGKLSDMVFKGAYPVAYDQADSQSIDGNGVMNFLVRLSPLKVE